MLSHTPGMAPDGISGLGSGAIPLNRSLLRASTSCTPSFRASVTCCIDCTKLWSSCAGYAPPEPVAAATVATSTEASSTASSLISPSAASHAGRPPLSITALKIVPQCWKQSVIISAVACVAPYRLCPKIFHVHQALGEDQFPTES